MNLVRQRYATDCGVAALATALGVTYEAARDALFPPGGRRSKNPGRAYWGVADGRMQAAVSEALGVDRVPSGVPLAQAFGQRGVLLVTRGCNDEWQDGTGKHWLAWWRGDDGRVTVYNPADGDTFDSQNLHVRGYRMVCHISVSCPVVFD